MSSSLALPLQIPLCFSDPVWAPSLFFQKIPPPAQPAPVYSHALTGLNQIQSYSITASHVHVLSFQLFMGRSVYARKGTGFRISCVFVCCVC